MRWLKVDFCLFCSKITVDFLNKFININAVNSTSLFYRFAS